VTRKAKDEHHTQMALENPPKPFVLNGMPPTVRRNPRPVQLMVIHSVASIQAKPRPTEKFIIKKIPLIKIDIDRFRAMEKYI